MQILPTFDQIKNLHTDFCASIYQLEMTNTLTAVVGIPLVMFGLGTTELLYAVTFLLVARVTHLVLRGEIKWSDIRSRLGHFLRSILQRASLWSNMLHQVRVNNGNRQIYSAGVKAGEGHLPVFDKTVSNCVYCTR